MQAETLDECPGCVALATTVAPGETLRCAACGTETRRSPAAPAPHAPAPTPVPASPADALEATLRALDGVQRLEDCARHRSVPLDHLRVDGGGADIPDLADRLDGRAWTKPLAAQHRLRALESAAATAVPAAVLRQLAHTCPPGTALADAAARMGTTFAHWKLREAWDAQALAAALARLASATHAPAGTRRGRPRADRTRAAPAVACRAFGLELVAWAVAVWRGQPHAAPTWCPAAYRGDQK